jgi:hypothetical protein
MKKSFTLISIFSVYVGSLWGQTPNAGFETWTHHTGLSAYDTPDSWDNANPSTAITGAITCFKAIGADVHSGTAALKIITKQIGAPFNQLIPGVATTGTINTTTQGIEAGVPYTLRPDSIIGWYKYNSVGAENGAAVLLLFGAAAGNKDTVGAAYFATPATSVSSYTRFSAPVVYRSANEVANSIWLFASSRNNGLASGIGSAMFVDDLEVAINPVGVSEQKKPKFLVGPNPTTDYLVIQNEYNSSVLFLLYDATGHIVAEEKLSNSESRIDVSNFSNGFYIYSITDENSKVTNTGEISIQK